MMIQVKPQTIDHDFFFQNTIFYLYFFYMITKSFSSSFCTLFEIFIFCPKIVDFLGEKLVKILRFGTF